MGLSDYYQSFLLVLSLCVCVCVCEPSWDHGWEANVLLAPLLGEDLPLPMQARGGSPG